jgi:hypothetical protein
MKSVRQSKSRGSALTSTRPRVKPNDEDSFDARRSGRSDSRAEIKVEPEIFPDESVTCVLIGDTGSGKSEFGNRYLNSSPFESGDTPEPVTLEPKVGSTVIDGFTRYVIDTEGHADGNSVSSTQIQKLAKFLKGWKKGVNGVCVVLNGQHDRFSQGIKDTLRWSYNTFGTPEVLNNICIIFTRCYAGIRNPNRERKRTDYCRCVRTFLSEVSGQEIGRIPEIPVFFVDSLGEDDLETERNFVQFHGWLVSREALSTKLVRAVDLRDRIEEETNDRFFVEYRYDGPAKDQYRYAVYESRKREKVTPYNGDPVRYGEWKVIDTWEEEAGHQKIVTRSLTHEIEWKEVEHHRGHSMSGFSRRAHTHYSIKRKKWQEQWTVTTDFDGNVTETEPKQVGEVSTQTVSSDRERGWTEAYERVIQ